MCRHSLLLLIALFLPEFAHADPLDCRAHAESMSHYQRVVTRLPGQAFLKLDYEYCREPAPHRGYFSEFEMRVEGRGTNQHLRFDFYPDSVALQDGLVVVGRSHHELRTYEEDRLVLAWTESWGWSSPLSLFGPKRVSTNATSVPDVVRLRGTIERLEELTLEVLTARQMGTPDAEMRAHQKAVELTRTRVSESWIRDRLAHVMRRSLATARTRTTRQRHQDAATVLFDALSLEWGTVSMLDLAMKRDPRVSASDWDLCEALLANSSVTRHVTALRRLRIVRSTGTPP